MTIRQRVSVFSAALLLALVLAFVAVARAAEPCSPGAICKLYPIWHPWYWYFHCELPPCPDEN